MARIPQHKRLYNLIKHDILSGTYEVGDLLPTEYEFASRHKVARSTVRQALAALEKKDTLKRGKAKAVWLLKEEGKSDFSISEVFRVLYLILRMIFC
ncbi:MAG: winged helix-turn-helix transcriptional regulator [Bacteroidetes bacterium]|nr:winged helix-turn-helix transcriptional regulator [Bacteroidota bacterium]